METLETGHVTVERVGKAGRDEAGRHTVHSTRVVYVPDVPAGTTARWDVRPVVGWKGIGPLRRCG